MGKTTTELPTDAAMRWWRDHSEFICTCRRPLPEPVEGLGWVDAWQCRICGRKYLATKDD